MNANVASRGPGPFVTHRVRRGASGGQLVATSRRHRKGLRPHWVPDLASADRAIPSHAEAFRHFWAPHRIAWWIAVLFVVGSALFTIGGGAATWPGYAPAWLRDGAVLGRVFVVGAILFTAAAWLQWLEAINGDVATALSDEPPRPWRWFGWLPRNMGYLASAIQLVGTLMFNFDTLDALIPSLSWQDQDALIWSPDMIGCICFIASSYLAFAEVSQGAASLAPRSISWWVAIANLAGSAAFEISALCSVALPAADTGASLAFWANFFTAVGGLCFLVGSYLLIPEMFDE